MATTGDSPAAPESAAPKNKRGNKGAGKGGKKALSTVAIARRVEAIQKIEDADKAKRARQRLVRNVLSGIADGGVRQPAKAAQAVLAIMPKKAAGAEAAEA